jgi:ankyrin repeat protein
MSYERALLEKTGDQPRLNGPDGAFVEDMNYLDVRACIKALDDGANPNVICDKHGQTALHILSVMEDYQKFVESVGGIDLFKILLDRGANPNLQDKYDETALHNAVMTKDVMMIRQLLDANADPNIKNISKSTPLDLLTDFRALLRLYDIERLSFYIEIVKMLIGAGAEWKHMFDVDDLIMMFGDDPNWLWKHLPEGPQRSALRRQGKSKGLFGI